MVCCLFCPSHYMNLDLWWQIILSTTYSGTSWNFIQNENYFLQWSAFNDNIVINHVVLALMCQMLMFIKCFMYIKYLTYIKYLMYQILRIKNKISWSSCHHYFNGLVYERCNSIATVLELRLSCTNPSIWSVNIICFATTKTTPVSAMS